MALAARQVRPGAALGVLAVSAVVVSDQRFVRGEGRLVEAVNDWPRAVGAPLEASMVLGTLAAGLALTVVVAVATGRPRATVAVFVATLLAWWLDGPAKDLLERPRPDPEVLDIVLRDPDATGFGFPSGHATMAFALAAVLHPVVPRRWRWAPWVIAGAVGVARVYVGVHFPMDVVGGAALGTAIGGTAALLVADGYRRRRT